MADQCDMIRDDVFVGLQIIHGAAEAPGPGRNAAPFVGSGACLARLVPEGVDAILEAVIEIGIDVAIIDSRERVAASQELLHLPAAGFAAAGLFRGEVVGDTQLLVVAHPGTRHRDSGIGMDGLVSVKIESEESGQGSGGGSWQIYKDIHLRAVGIASKKYRYFLAR